MGGGACVGVELWAAESTGGGEGQVRMRRRRNEAAGFCSVASGYRATGACVELFPAATAYERPARRSPPAAHMRSVSLPEAG